MIKKSIIEKENIFCDYYNKNIKMSTKYSIIEEKKIPVEKNCSEWEFCENRQFCKYGKK